MMYIEHPNGTSINGRLAAEICEYARSIWRDLYSRRLAPEKWRDALRKVQDQYTHEMEKRWPILCYCKNHWKAHYLTTKNYPQWYKVYNRKMIVKGKKNKTNEPAQKKRRTMIEDDDPSNSQSDSETGTGDGSIPEALGEGSNRDNDRPSWLEEDTQEEHRRGILRPRARPLRDPL